MPECEAHRRNKQALHEIELAWGNGVTDLGKLKKILIGEPCDCTDARCAGKVDGSGPPRES